MNVNVNACVEHSQPSSVEMCMKRESMRYICCADKNEDESRICRFRLGICILT